MLAMPLFLHASNDLERLGAGLVRALAADLRGGGPEAVFAEVLVLVPTVGLRDWLRQQIASGLGICAGVRLSYPGQLLGWLRQPLGQAEEQPAWDAEQARWLCLREQAEIDTLVRYLGEEARQPGRRAYALATELVACFERYGLYRDQQTLEAWAAGEVGLADAGSAWQAELWCRLLRAGVWPPQREFGDLLQALEQGTVASPARLYAFGFNSLSPQLQRLLAVLAQRSDVHIASLQPTWGYWGDEHRRLRELVRQGLPDYEWGNRLLGDWGAVGREFLVGLDAVGAHYQADPDDFRDPGDSCLLHRLQQDLNLAQAPSDAGAYPLRPGDDSLTFHACHSLRRQLEVVKAELHRAFAADPGLQAADVAVMCPDPQTVAPVAAAIMAGSGFGPPIAVAIADRRLRGMNPAADVLLRLLDLLPGRWAASEVLDLLGCAAVATAWGLGADELERIRRWIDAADLRWGCDAAHRKETVGHAFSAGSWRRGLQRLQLAWWFGADAASARLYGTDDDAAEAVVPVTGIEPEDFTTLKRLSLLLTPLLDAAAACRQAQSVDWWQQQLPRLLAQTLRCSDQDPDLASVVGELAGWADGLRRLDWQQPLRHELVAAALAARFEQSSGGEFGRGAVTICGMQPMRSVPFRVLCLVGMDDGAFPREARSLDFDLLRQRPQPGDRNLRAEDRYLLLELLVSVRDRLLITYQGFDKRDQSELPPAVPVGELLTQAAATCACDSHSIWQSLGREHRLHASLEQPQPWPSRMLCDEYLALQGRRRRHDVASPLPAVEAPRHLELTDLLSFWRQPARGYLRRLGIQVTEFIEAPREHERFGLLRGLDRYAAANRLLTRQEEAASLRQRLAAEGWIAPGALGEGAWQQLWDFVEQLRQRHQTLWPDCQPQRLRLAIGGVQLAAELPLVHPHRGVVVVHPGRFSESRRLELWLQLLVAAAAGVADRGVLFGVGRSGLVVEQVLPAPAETTALLTTLLDGYQAGRQTRLPFALRTSYAYAGKRWRQRRPATHGKALAAARTQWSETIPVVGAPPPECQYPAHRLLWPPGSSPVDQADFVNWAAAVWQPLLRAQEGK
jgi:exodeoxyribonuclease V gamma subunit